MEIHRITISAVAICAFFLTAVGAWSQSGRAATTQYREAYITLQDALKLQYENRKEEALHRYEEARDKLKDLLVQFPDMNREIIEARIAKCGEAIAALKEEVSAVPEREVTAPVQVAEEPAPDSGGSYIPVTTGMSPPEAPRPDTVAMEFERKKLRAEVAELQNKLQAAETDIDKSLQEKAAVEAEFEKARAEAENMRREIQNINTSLGMAIADLEKEREVKAKIEEDAVSAHKSSEEILKGQLAQALEDKKKIETEAMQAYQASEEIMRDQLEKQKQDHLNEIKQERQKAALENEAAPPPIEQLQNYISAYREEVEKARGELNESLKMIASSQETHRRLLEANRDLEKRIGALSESVARTEKEAELIDLSQTTAAEEEKLKKPDIMRGPSPPSPVEKQVLAGEISEKNDEYGKVFIDFSTDVKEGEDLLVVRDHEVIAKLKVSKVFTSIKGGIANVTPKEDTYELREKDKVFVSRRETSTPSP